LFHPQAAIQVVREEGEAAMTDRGWPERFQVTLLTRTGRSVSYSVVTGLGEGKAIALAVTAHLRTSTTHGGDGILDVTVIDLGPLKKGASGEMVFERADLTDRSEF
jgi:hypothetical protein